MGVLIRFARQFVAGETIDDAVSRAREVNARGMGAIVNLLGEHYHDFAKAAGATAEYRRLLRTLDGASLDASVSVKLTQIGLGAGVEACRQNLRDLVEEFRTTRRFLWIDMEGSPYTQATLDLYGEALTSYRDVGVCLQANLKRTEQDLHAVIDAGGAVRLTKGAYKEPAAVAHTARADVDASYERLLGILFARAERFAVATHDRRLVDLTLRHHQERPRRFEFQMLLGVQTPLKEELAARGFRVAEYIPYGPEWLRYFGRRLRERPRNVITMVRSFVSG